jgi:hypothetical protein
LTGASTAGVEGAVAPSLPFAGSVVAVSVCPKATRHVGPKNITAAIKTDPTHDR